MYGWEVSWVRRTGGVMSVRGSLYRGIGMVVWEVPPRELFHSHCLWYVVHLASIGCAACFEDVGRCRVMLSSYNQKLERCDPEHEKGIEGRLDQKALVLLIIRLTSRPSLSLSLCSIIGRTPDPGPANRGMH